MSDSFLEEALQGHCLNQPELLFTYGYLSSLRLTSSNPRDANRRQALGWNKASLFVSAATLVKTKADAGVIISVKVLCEQGDFPLKGGKK